MTAEHSAIADLAARRAAAEAQTYERSDLGNARRLVDTHGAALRFVAGLGWHVLAGNGRWQLDQTGEPTRRMAAVSVAMFAEALELSGDDRKKASAHARASQGARRIAAALELAAVDERIVVTAEQLDAHPHLLAVANGTVDLRDGTLRPGDPADLLTLGSSVRLDPRAPCPRWERFLLEVFAEDRDLIGGVQRLVGYVLTGDTREHVLPVLHGDGANGKSVFVGVLEQLLGDLARTAAFSTFLDGHGGNVDYDLARLRGARLVVAQESARGRRLAETVVKQVTGGDTITARHPYGRPFSYRPMFTAVLVTNHRPRADATDEAIWRRLRLVPFAVSFRGREDRGLARALTRELPGILAWAVRGAVEWHEHGLDWPPAVTAATAAYRAEEDVAAAFLAEECHLDAAERTPVAEVRERYDHWAKATGERAVGAKLLTQALAGHGIHAVKGAQGRRFYAGVALSHRWQVAGGGGSSQDFPPACAQGEVPEKRATTCHLPPDDEQRDDTTEETPSIPNPSESVVDLRTLATAWANDTGSA
jgi:putative DNA primase/helicase